MVKIILKIQTIYRINKINKKQIQMGESSHDQGLEKTDILSCPNAVKSTCVQTVQWLQCTVNYVVSLIVRVGMNNIKLYTNVVFF